MKNALELDPLSVLAYAYLGMVCLNAGKPDIAVEYIHQALELDPNYLPAHGFLGQFYLIKGDFDQAIEVFEKQCRIQPAPIAFANLGHAYASAGREKEARKILAQLCEQSKKHDIQPLYFALIYLGLNEREQMWESLENSFQEHSVLLPAWLNTDRRFQILRGEPRFNDLLRRIGFEVE
jgi:tetratricopeptide (TPR) repeat protein